MTIIYHYFDRAPDTDPSTLQLDAADAIQLFGDDFIRNLTVSEAEAFQVGTGVWTVDHELNHRENWEFEAVVNA